MEESDYYSLGYNFDNEKVGFANVLDKAFTTKIGKLTMKIDGHVIGDVPIAFSKEPIQTLLLGRLKIFDNFEVCFDNIKKQTILSRRA